MKIYISHHNGQLWECPLELIHDAFIATEDGSDITPEASAANEALAAALGSHPSTVVRTTPDAPEAVIEPPVAPESPVEEAPPAEDPETPVA